MSAREEIIAAVGKYRLITIARGFNTDELIKAAEALYDGGVRLMEVTYDAKSNPTDEVTAERIGILAERFKGRMYIGAGTVLTPRQVEMTRDAGGLFIISPTYSEAVIKKTRELDLVSIPGCMTPTECLAAHDWGADFIKLFPNSELGPDYIKAISAPLSHIKYLAVGGVTLDNLDKYMKAGACGIGVASGILDKKVIKAGDFDTIRKLAKAYSDKLTVTGD